MVDEIIGKIATEILNPLVTVLFAAALVYFLLGGFMFIRDADSDDGRRTGRSHMIWGIVGMFIMLAVHGIIRVLTNTFGVDLPS